MIRPLAGSVLACALLVAPARAEVLDAFLFGVDLDQFSTPADLRPTEVGFESLLRCTTFSGDPISQGCQGPIFEPNTGSPRSGYLEDLDGPFTDISFTPLDADFPDLWTDAHRTDANGATIRIGDLDPGTYQVVLISQRPSIVPLRTCFRLQGQDRGCIEFGPEIPLRVGISYSLVADGVEVGEGGELDVFFWDGSGAGQGGWLNAIVIIPEPSGVALLAAGLLGLVGLGRRNQRRSRGSARV